MSYMPVLFHTDLSQITDGNFITFSHQNALIRDLFSCQENGNGAI